MNKMDEVLQIIDPERGRRGYTTLFDIVTANTRGSAQVRLRMPDGKTLSDYRESLPPGPRAVFDRDHPGTTIHVDNLKRAELVPLALRYKIQVRSAQGWGDAKRESEPGEFTLLAFRNKREANKELAESFDKAECRVVPIQERADVDLYGYVQAIVRGEPPPKPRPKLRV